MVLPDKRQNEAKDHLKLIGNQDEDRRSVYTSADIDHDGSLRLMRLMRPDEA